MSEKQRAARLREKIKKTWSPPETGFGRNADIAQSSVMISLAFIFGKDFLGPLSTNQENAVNGGLDSFNKDIDLSEQAGYNLASGRNKRRPQT